MVFCVSQDHAEQVRDWLNRLNADLNVPNYAVRIVSEEADAQAWLEKFQAVDKPTPVVASTVDLLTTGVDAPSVRNIVFFKTIASPTVFKQIVGRGHPAVRGHGEILVPRHRLYRRFATVRRMGQTDTIPGWRTEGDRPAGLLAGRKSDFGRDWSAIGGCCSHRADRSQRDPAAANRF